MRRYMCILILMVISSTFLFGEYIDSGREPQIELLSQDFNSIQLFFSGTKLGVEKIENKNGNFSVLSFQGSSPGGEVGEPELPVIRKMIQIPFGAEPRISTENIDYKEFSLDDYGYSNPIIPLQLPWPKIEGYEVPFQQDKEVYLSNSYYFEEDVIIVNIDIARSYKIMLLEIRPVNYNPVSNKISVIQKMDIVIELPGADIARTTEIKEHYSSSAYDEMLRPSLLNPHAYETTRWVPSVNDLGYLIITESTYLDTVEKLALWKWRKGYSVKVKTESELGGTANNIRNWILDEYDTASVAPSFVLLVGDVGDIPAFSGGSSGSASDTPYGNMDASGYIPELFVGRISPENIDQLGHFIQRIIDYEHFNYSSSHLNFADKACFLASNDSYHWDVAEATHRYAITTHFGPAGFACDSIWAHSDPSHHTNTISAINDGRTIVNYSGHGGYYSWEAPDVEASDVEGLTNTDEYPFVISNACITGTYSLGECFGETWIRQYNKGAISFVGASNNSYWDEDDEMERRMYDAVFDDGYYFTSGMINRGLNGVYAAYPSNAEYYYDIYNLLGDPSLAVWFRQPASMTVLHPSELSTVSTIDIDVSSGGSSLQNALVCVTNDDDIHSVGYTNASGDITLDISGANLGDTLWITVTAYNKIPYESYCVIGGSRPWIAFSSLNIDDSAGDNDGNVDIGEDVDLYVTLENTGSENAYSIVGWLRTTEPAIDILDSMASFGNIPSSATATNSSPFEIVVGSGLTNGEILNFDLYTEDVDDSSWNVEFDVQCFAPILSYDSKTIDDATGGDGDTYPEPGENIDLVTNILNSGNETARFITLDLSVVPNAFVSVVSSSSGIDSINPGEIEGSNTPFEIQISSSCPTPFIAHLIIEAIDYRGPYCCDTFQLIVGSGGFFYDCESGSGSWFPDTIWHISDRRSASPGHSWYSGIDGSYMHHDTLNPILLSPESLVPDNPLFSFWHYFSTEYDYDSCYVGFSIDGGSSWTVLDGFNSVSERWRFAHYDLSSYPDVIPGSTIQFAFQQYGDTYVHGEGWYIDDIELGHAQNAYLGAGTVEPFSGTTATNFRFIVGYCSPDGHNPTSAKVYINGVGHDMVYFSGLLSENSIWEYNSNMALGVHSYHYEFIVEGHTYRFPQAGEIDGPFISAPFYEFDIGNDASGLTHYGPRDDWEYGIPSSGPGSVPIGNKCWATQIDGNYQDSSRSRLVLPTMDLTDIESPYLCFYHWYRFQSSDTRSYHDGGNVKICVDGSPDTFVVHPQLGYDGNASRYNLFVDWETVYGDDDIGNLWQFEAIDLSPWEGHNVSVAFDFGSSSVNTEFGWYINNIYLIGATETGIVSSDSRKVPRQIGLRASPNPFNSIIELDIYVPESPAELFIYDISGRLIDNLSDKLKTGSQKINWAPENISSGIYFAKLECSGNKAMIQLILMK